MTGFSLVEGKKGPRAHKHFCNFVLVAFLSDRLRHETRSAAGEHIDCCIDRVWEIMGDMVRDFWMLLMVPPPQSCRALLTFTINPQLTYTISPCSTFSINLSHFSYTLRATPTGSNTCVIPFILLVVTPCILKYIRSLA